MIRIMALFGEFWGEKTKPFHSVRMKRIEYVVPRKGLGAIATEQIWGIIA